MFTGGELGRIPLLPWPIAGMLIAPAFVIGLLVGHFTTREKPSSTTSVTCGPTRLIGTPVWITGKYEISTDDPMGQLIRNSVMCGLHYDMLRKRD